MSKFYQNTALGFLIVLVFSGSQVFGQGSPLSFTESKTIEGISSADLYNRAKESLSTSFLQSNLQLLEVNETEGEKITGNSLASFATKDAQLRTVASGEISFTFEVTVKNNEATIELGNWEHIPSKSKYYFGQLTTDEECPIKVGGTMKKSRVNVWADLITTANEVSEAVLSNFINGLDTKSDGNANLSAQQWADGMPLDIKTVGIIILKHEMAEIDYDNEESNSDELKNKNKEQHNVMAAKANEKLDGVLKNFPYKYVVANSRSELDNLKKEGYKYVLDCIAYDNMKNGNYKSSAKIEYFYELYIKDLTTNENYFLTNKLSERSVYDYKMMINKYLKSAIDDM